MNENERPNEYRYCSWCKKNVDSKQFNQHQVCEPCRAKMKKKKVKTIVQEATSAPPVVPVPVVAIPPPPVAVTPQEIKAAPLPPTTIPKKIAPTQLRLKKIIEQQEQQADSATDSDNDGDNEDSEIDLSIEPPQKPVLRRQNAYENKPAPKIQLLPAPKAKEPEPETPKEKPFTHISIFG